MKYFLSVLLFLANLPIYSQEPSEKTLDRRIDFLLSKPDSLSKSEKAELKDLAYKIQNEGFLGEEMNNDYNNSLIQIDKALPIWRILHDTVNEANIRKYKGYLLGHLGKFDDAKAEIFRAINLFTKKHLGFGVAVSEFDLSKVYDMESKSDSALFYANSSLDFWKRKNDTFRLVVGNNQLINLFYKKKEYSKAESIQLQSKEMTIKPLHWRPLIDFYFLSSRLYKKINNRKLKNYYSALYKKELNNLKKENIITRSYYAVSK